MAARLRSTTLGDQAFAGFVKRVSPVVEAQAGTVKVVVGVRELGALRPGMWVDVELVLDARENAVLLPKPAIVYDNDQRFAFRVEPDANQVLVARRHPVRPRNEDKEHIEPEEGFEAGDRIVIAGQSGLKEGSPVYELEPEGSLTNAPTSGLASADTNQTANAKAQAN
jgi:membrane fusion protein (multidrug efflux system)